MRDGTVSLVSYHMHHLVCLQGDGADGTAYHLRAVHLVQPGNRHQGFPDLHTLGGDHAHVVRARAAVNLHPGGALELVHVIKQRHGHVDVGQQVVIANVRELLHQLILYRVPQRL